MAKIIPITEHFQHFLAEMKESFWGDLYGQTRQAWQQFFELQSERQRDRFSGGGGMNAGGETASLPQRLLRAGFRNPVRDDSAAHRAHPGEELSAGGAAAISATGGRGFAADPGSVFARDQDPAGGTGGGHHHRRDGERADGVEADAGSGRGGAPVSSGAVER